MSSKAPPKSKSPAKKQTTTKARKGSAAAAGAGSRSQASARARTTAKKTAAGTARRSEVRRAAKQPEAPEDDAVKPEAGAGRTKGAAAPKASRSSGSAKATRTGRATKTAKPAKAARGGGGTKTGRAGKAGAGGKGGAGGEARRKKKAPTKVNGFAVGDHVVYPAHGVGRITGIDERAVGDQTLQMFVVAFEKDKMTLLVPTGKVDSAGMRRLSSRETMDAAIAALRGRARTRRVMWSRRAQEYEAKLNSGDPVSIAEVVRDLHRNVGQPDQSYSERQMYEAALDRLAREFAAVENTDTEQAANKLEDVLRAA